MRFEPEDIKRVREGADLSDVIMLRQIDKVDHTIEQMTKVWKAIQENLRHPWRQ